jgi:uncharacterized protein (TIGR00266 family)
MSDKFWYIAVGGQQQGPISRDEVVAGIRSGRFGRDAHVFSQGMANWVPITSQQEFAEAFGGPAAGAPPPLPPGMAAGPGPAPAKAHEIDYELFGEDMQYLEVTLDPNEACIAEAGAFMYMDPGIQMQTIFGDGSGQDQGSGFMGKLLSAGKRIVTGESLFMTMFGNSGPGRQKVAFAAPYPGKIIPVDLKQHGGRLLCEKDAFLCAAKGISVGIALNRKLGAGLFGGEGFILQKLEGDGLAFLHSGGTILSRQLNPGETLRVDTGCIVAFESTVNYDIQMVSGIKTAFFGGEGLFYAVLTGPGRIWLQSLPFKRLAMQVLSAIPRNKGEGSALGGIGSILMGGDD